MIRNTISKFAAVLCLAIMFTLTATVFGQRADRTQDSKQVTRLAAPSAVFVEDFNYPAGTALTTAGWTGHSAAGTNPILVTAPGLNFLGWPSAGNAVTMTTSGEDAHRTFPVVSAGSVYVGVLVNLSEASTDAIGGYFFHLAPDPIGTTFRGRLFARKDASNNVSFGFTKASTSTPADIVYTPFTYALNTTYLMVVKYTIVDGVTNDTAALFINPTPGGAEPAATLTATDIGASDINPGSFALRQGTAATHPTARVDGIRMSTTWAGLVTAQPNAAVDFNGDGKTDWAVVRNTGGGASGQLTWFWNNNGDGSPTQASAWGLNTDVLTPADFDGDNKTDIAVWRPAAALTAAFYILQSQTNTVRIDQFGQTADNPTVIADYNGDGRDDVAVFRASAGTWYYRTTAGGPITYTPWGTSGDFVAPGDYDGDGKADFGIQRDNGGAGNFWIRLSTGTILPVTQFGLSSDFVITGDFDGDARTDIAVSRQSIATWYWIPSSGGAQQSAVFGLSADTLVPGDYDGDGKTDVAVFRSGVFYVRSANGGVSYFTLGASGDRLPAVYNVH